MSLADIEDVPMPRQHLGRKRKYPFDELKVGQSFYADIEHMAGAIKLAEQRTGFKFRRVQMDGGLRIFRVK